MQKNKEEIRAFLSRYFRTAELTDDDDIFALGLVNSLFAMQLVLFLEQKFKITIESDDLEIDNFRTINAIARLLERKTAVSTQTV
jgi:methoxymalonate biosynthesis acyl carrier protein